MKTGYIIALSSLLAFAACQNNVDITEESVLNSDKVTAEFSVRVPDTEVGTKAFGETPVFETNGLYVIVYEGGYRCEVAQAVISGAPTTGANGEFIYKYSLTLSTSGSPRNLHFVSMEGFTAAMAPYEESRLGAEMYSENGVDAYWQRVKLSEISDKPSELASAIGTVNMIRNFAKITMSTSSSVNNFELISYKVYNTPSRGHIAPYIVSGTASGYIDGYENMTYAEAYESYPGKIPAGATINGYDDTYASQDQAGSKSATPSYGWVAADASTYFYERPIPTENPAFIIVYGNFKEFNTNGTVKKTTACYYKINLQDNDGKYYALLRNFRFKINILDVKEVGCTTLKAAIESAGSGNISTSLDYIDVTNISDNNCRLFVSTTSVTTVKATTITIKYKFCPKASDISTVANGEVDFSANNNNGIEVILNDPEDGGYPSVDSYVVYDESTDKDNDGYNYITVTTTAPESMYKEQILTIRGRGTNGTAPNTTTSIIQREIHIIVRPVLTLAANSPTTLNNPQTAKQSVDIVFGLQTNLPKSIFPLNVKIETEKMTLTPDNTKSNNNMPVESGISDVTGKPAFHFVKTVTWDMYNSASTADFSGQTLVKFDCYFITNTGTASASTNVNVSCDLFNAASFTL